MTADPTANKRRAAAQGQPAQRRGGERPSHPGVAATVLMIGVVVLLVLVAAQPMITCGRAPQLVGVPAVSPTAQ
ncbi:MAG: hypothetical protein ACK5O2_10535, partial [Microthrixaceae bacterium]